MISQSARKPIRFSILAILLLVSQRAVPVALAQTATDQSNVVSPFTCLNAGFYTTMIQSFTPSFDKLNFADIHLSGGKGSAIDGDFSVQLLQNNNVIGESDRVVIPATGGAVGAYHRFAFDDPEFLSPGQQYQLKLVNHSNSSYFAWCQSQGNDYSGGSSTVSPSSSTTGDFLFRTGMQSVFGPAQTPYGSGYTVFQSAFKPQTNPGSGSSISVSSTFFSGLNFEITQPTTLSRIGGYFSSGSGQIFGAVFKTTGFTGVPNPANLSGSDVVATTLLNVPSGGGDASGAVDVTLNPGWYGVVFGSGKFGATGSTGLRDVGSSTGFYEPYSIRQSDGSRFFQSGDYRVFAEATSAPGTATVHPTFDTQAEKFAGQWILTDGGSSIVGDRFDFYGTDDRALMEFSLSHVPKNATITSATLRLTPTQITSGPGGAGPRLFFNGYRGDGVASAADADVPLNEIGSTPVITTFDPINVTLSPTYLQSLLSQGASQLGLMVRGDDNGHRAFFATWEGGSVDEVPTLTINFKIAGDYDGNGVVNAADYAVWRQNFGSTNASADGNGNGKVDAADYIVWRNSMAAASGSGSFAEAAAVPEPLTTALVLLATAIAPLGCHRGRSSS